MRKLLSLPPNAVKDYNRLHERSRDEFFCTSDPRGKRLGSGSGTTWLLEEGREWLSDEKRILVHAGGQSRRLPAYAVTGKISLPVPVFRWARGQRLSQDLLSLQLPLYEKIMKMAPESLRTLIVSGDVYIHAGEPLQEIPKADVVCYGLWVDSSLATRHGVFAARRDAPDVLDRMLQKPSLEELEGLSRSHFVLMDIGLWLLSDRAVNLLRERSYDSNGDLQFYDLYGDFGLCLGTNPSKQDGEVNGLSVKILPLNGGEFYHFGTSREMISSTLALQNRVYDQRLIMHRKIKPNPAIFTQNSRIGIGFNESHRNIWIENSHVGSGWRLSSDHVITGVPANDWNIDLPPGVCVDIVPVGEQGYAVRVYHIDDKFAGDLQSRRLFPYVESLDDMKEAIERMADDYVRMGLPAPDALPDDADRMQQIHNRMLRSRILSQPGAHQSSRKNISSETENNHSNNTEAEFEESEAFSLLRNGLIEAVADKKRSPRMAAFPDQIVWGRSPVRIDLAGGWTDTPPFSLYAGGNVVNMAVELNGQPPLQVYVKPCREHHIVLRSIDMGATEVVTTFDELRDFRRLGSPFSIPKAALGLCGFLPELAAESFGSLEEQLRAFGGGLELTLLAAIPAGSGLGTSSILASTVLGALNDFCGLNWSRQDICTETLVLEQLLTSGGGWQDQQGGIFHGVKLLESDRGFIQKPLISWLPDYMFTDPVHASCHLLYYTGITRVAKNILGEIVRGMFLNSAQHLSILHEMKMHALDMAECIQRGDFERYGKLILKTWDQNKRIDSGTNPPEVEQIIDLIKDYTLGYKLPGAGGGGYLYMVAKDPEAVGRIRKVLQDNPPNDKARFVEMQLSNKGFQVSRS
jgi:galactokinase/mevalonate kinase-like predicted kinase